MSNAVLQIIEARRSVRLFDDKEIAEEDLMTVLKAANQAPSAHNQQPWRFIILSGARKQELAALIVKRAPEFPRSSSVLLRMAAKSISSAPVVIGVANTGELVTHGAELLGGDSEQVHDFFRTMEIQSSAAAVENLLLAATSLGISSVWLGVLILIKDDVLRFFEEEEGEFMAVVPLGYCEKVRSMPAKKALAAKIKYL